jgi:drug/metabolite transporter (DMT)-like permease
MSTTTALFLVIVAAFAHAAWNLLAKTASGGAVFVWLCAVCGTAIYLPALAIALAVAPGRLDAVAGLFVLGSGVLHALYFVILQRGYREGELSVVYPLARGTGPLLATIAAILVFGERPSPLAAAGAGIIVVAVLSLVVAPRRFSGVRRGGWLYGVVTGAAIASYTLWDKQAVGVLALSPIVYYWATNLANALTLTPWVLRDRAAIAETWHRFRAQTVGVAVLSPLAYVLVLFALALAPVSYVAPARELSILIATVLGIGLLGESDGRWRLICAAAIVIGVSALAIG